MIRCKHCEGLIFNLSHEHTNKDIITITCVGCGANISGYFDDCENPDGSFETDYFFEEI